MNSPSEQLPVDPLKSTEFTPSAATLIVILAGCLFSGLLLWFLFQDILQGKYRQTTINPAACPSNVVSTRTQPEVPTSPLERIRLATNQSQSKQHLNRIALAVHNYHSTFGVLPPGRTETESGTPYHGWQTSILPHIDQYELYDQINFDRPWNDPQNYKVFQQQVPEYLNPAIQEKVAPDGTALSHYVGNSLLLKKNQSMPFESISDGRDYTILAVERGNNFHTWGDPASLADPQQIIGPDQISAFPDGTQALMSSGAVRFLSRDIDPAILKALSTPDSNDSTGDF
ncbi:hypothetical protein Enr10x_34650 [Gimesia panareensis]|uniref:DUF1559 domain-containing protein n=1 Tax=Gimesia panareensis TaxID=2527978 RepID=A0A517Q933_9PLAN|nr:DUF1559 domain-containing protein [Gimesia panareensis]QDT28126.1 hypothetical protein Enr10x_34650 [Gimesia panareensis]